MAKKRTDEEIAEKYFRARLKNPKAKPPASCSPCEFSPRLLEAINRSMVKGCTHGDRISRGKMLAKERRLAEEKTKDTCRKNGKRE